MEFHGYFILCDSMCVCVCPLPVSSAGAPVWTGRGVARCESRIADSHSDSDACSPGPATPHTSPPTPASPSPVLTTSQILLKTLSRYQKNLSAAHINAESLRGHFDEIRELFGPLNFDIITISESWLKPSINSHVVALPGYILYRNDRTNKKCGGVAAYIKEDIKCKVLYSTPCDYSARPEFMFLELCLPGAKALLLGVCYKPPKIGHLADFETVLLRFLPGYSRVLIMGDFNTDLLKTQTNDFTELTTMFNSCNLTILPLDPTHHTSTSHTLLDLMVVSDPSDIIHHGQLPVPAISRHELVYCVFSFKAPKPKTKFINYRDFKHMDEIAFLQDVYQIPWHSIRELDSVDAMVDSLNTTITDLYNKHAPIVTKRISKRNSIPWMTQEILNLMARRDYFFRKSKTSND